MKLYGFFRSGTSHRLRIALNLKQLSYKQVAIDLRKDEHQGDTYRAVNPQQLVPALSVGDEVLTQTPAIIEWLEERYPNPPLLPKDEIPRAKARALAAIVGCDIHPINNRRILEYLRHRFGADETAIKDWCSTWIASGFDAFQALMLSSGMKGRFACGDRPTIADVYLIPQIESARRFGVDVSRWPALCEVDTVCGQLEAFRNAAPALQPDAV